MPHLLGTTFNFGATASGVSPTANSARLSYTLHQTLGDEAAEDLVNWMVHMDASRSEFREMMELHDARTESRFAAIDGRFAAIDGRFTAMEYTMEAGFARMEAKFERRFGDLLKWSFVFWCGAVGSVAALARVLNQP